MGGDTNKCYKVLVLIILGWELLHRGQPCYAKPPLIPPTLHLHVALCHFSAKEASVFIPLLPIICDQSKSANKLLFAVGRRTDDEEGPAGYLSDVCTATQMTGRHGILGVSCEDG